MAKSAGHIRRAAASDRDDVIRLWMDLLQSQSECDSRFTPADDAQVRWRNDFAEWLDRPSRRLFVAELDGRVRGFVTAQRWSLPPVYEASAEVYIDELYVDPPARRQGLATSLVAAVREWAESLGSARLRAGVLAANESGRTFWSRVGAEPISVTYGIELDSSEEQTNQPERHRIGF